MLYMIWRQWCLEPGRTAMAGAVYAAVVGIAMLFDGIHFGLIDDLREYPASLPADLVAIESGNASLSLSPSSLPQLERVRAEAVSGVREAQPIMLMPFIFRANGKQTPSMLVAFDEGGGPRRFSAGRAPENSDEAVLDRNLAQRHGLTLGDPVTILDYDMTLVGLSLSTSSPFTPYGFITYDRFLDQVLELDLPFGTGDSSLVALLLIDIEDGAPLDKLRQGLEAALPDSDIYTPAELGDADSDFGDRLLSPMFALVTGIAWLIALLSMSMLRYADVQAHLREFGIQKALGASPRWLAGNLVLAGLLVALAAFPFAMLFAKGFEWLTAAWNPLYRAQVWESGVVLRGLVVAVLGSTAGGLLWLRRLMRLDPVIVFQR